MHPSLMKKEIQRIKLILRWKKKIWMLRWKFKISQLLLLLNKIIRSKMKLKLKQLMQSSTLLVVRTSLMKLFTKRVHKDMLIEKLFSNLISEFKYSEHGIAGIRKVLAGHIGTIGNYKQRSCSLTGFCCRARLH